MSLYEKLLKVQAELKAPKNQKNNFGGYNYRSCEDILESVKPLLTKYKATVMIRDEIILIGDRFYIKATAEFIDVETGESREVSALAREEQIKKGMDSSQITGSASSYARKYALNGLFLIDDTKDADATNTHESELTEKQLNRLYAIAFSKGINRDKVNTQIKKKFNKEISKLSKEEYDIIVKGYESINK